MPARLATQAQSAADFMRLREREWERKRGAPSIRMKDIGRRGWTIWARDAWTMRAQSNYPSKVLVLERLRFVELIAERAYPWDGGPGDIEYRIGYYTLSPLSGRWVWGQFAAMIPQVDLYTLLARARADGTLDAALLPRFKPALKETPKGSK